MSGRRLSSTRLTGALNRGASGAPIMPHFGAKPPLTISGELEEKRVGREDLGERAKVGPQTLDERAVAAERARLEGAVVVDALNDAGVVGTALFFLFALLLF